MVIRTIRSQSLMTLCSNADNSNLSPTSLMLRQCIAVDTYEHEALTENDLKESMLASVKLRSIFGMTYSYAFEGLFSLFMGLLSRFEYF